MKLKPRITGRPDATRSLGGTLLMTSDLFHPTSHGHEGEMLRLLTTPAGYQLPCQKVFSHVLHILEKQEGRVR